MDPAAPVAAGGLVPPADAEGPPVTLSPPAFASGWSQISLSPKNLEILLPDAHAHRDEALDPGGVPPPPGHAGADRPAFCAWVTFLLEGDAQAAPQSFPLVLRAYWEYRASTGRHVYRRMLSVGVTAFRAGARLQPGDTLVCRRAGGEAGLVVRVSVQRAPGPPPGRPPPPPPRPVPPPLLPDADGPPVTFPAAPLLCAWLGPKIFLSSEHLEILLPNAHAHRDEALDPGGVPPPPGQAGADRPAFCAWVTFLLEGDAQAAPQSFPLVLRAYWEYRANEGQHRYNPELSAGVAAFRAGARLRSGDTLVCRRAGGEAGLVVRVSVRRGENRP